MDSPLQIGVLGDLVVGRDGRNLQLPASRKTRALLAYLAVVGRSQRRDHLCDLLWQLPIDPRASLRWSLHRLRQVLRIECPNLLVADRDHLHLDPTLFRTELDELCRPDRREVEKLDTATLARMAGLFRGGFLDDLELPRCPAFEAWRTYHARWADGLRRRIASAMEERDIDPVDLIADARFQTRFGSERPVEAGKPTAANTPGGGAVARALESGPLRSQTVRFCRSAGEVEVAYATCGTGAPLVRAAHWMSHLTYDWESPVWRHWIDGLSDRMTLLRYDERGNGLSDRHVTDLSFGAMVSDLESVVDAAGLDRFALLGVSQSCAVAVEYCVRHPERLSALILYGGYARGWRRRGSRQEVDRHSAMTTLIREGWGQSNASFRQLFTGMFIPGATAEQMAWFNELQRSTVTPETASRLHESFGSMDVSHRLRAVAVPTLVLHARRDAAVPFHSGRELAIGIPGARFVDLDSSNHILLEDEPAFGEFLREVRAFVALHGERTATHRPH